MTISPLPSPDLTVVELPPASDHSVEAPSPANGVAQEPPPGTLWPPHWSARSLLTEDKPLPGTWPMPPGTSSYPAYAAAYPPWQHPTQPIIVPGNPADTNSVTSIPSCSPSSTPPEHPTQLPPPLKIPRNPADTGPVLPGTPSPPYSPVIPEPPYSAYAGAHIPWQRPTRLPPPIIIPGNLADIAPVSPSSPFPPLITPYSLGISPIPVSPGSSRTSTPTQPSYPPSPLPPGVVYPSIPVSRIDPFADGPHYGPVLEPLLAKIMGVVIKLNPLLAPPSDTPGDYLRWNMLFRTNICYRTTEFQSSWVEGRNAPATYPRLTHIRIICRAFPWMIDAHAQDPKLGVTCVGVLDAISACMYRIVTQKEFEHLDPGRRRQISGSFLNRITDSNEPGGRPEEGVKRLDWLGSASRFGGLVANDTFVKEYCGDMLPCTFELKCLPSRLMRRTTIRQDHWDNHIREKEV